MASLHYSTHLSHPINSLQTHLQSTWPPLVPIINHSDPTQAWSELKMWFLYVSSTLFILSYMTTTTSSLRTWAAFLVAPITKDALILQEGEEAVKCWEPLIAKRETTLNSKHLNKSGIRKELTWYLRGSFSTGYVLFRPVTLNLSSLNNTPRPNPAEISGEKEMSSSLQALFGVPLYSPSSHSIWVATGDSRLDLSSILKEQRFHHPTISLKSQILFFAKDFQLKHLNYTAWAQKKGKKMWNWIAPPFMTK